MSAFVAAMRAALALVGLAALLACSVGRRSAAEASAPPATATTTLASEPARGQVETGTEGARVEQVDAAGQMLAEVQAMEPPARWAWALATMPELVEHREAGSAAERWAELRRLAGARSTLWVRARGDRCFVVRGAWEDEGFFGRARETVKIKGDAKSVRFESVDITEGGIVLSGPHGDDFVRDARGRWQNNGGFGLGSFATIADGPVFEVTRKAAYYGGAEYSLTIECSETSVQEERCTDGTTRRCERCSSLWARPHGPQVGSAGARMSHVSAGDRQVDCSVPCPSDEFTPKLAALNLAVQGRTFVMVDAPDAAVYTEAGACRGDRRMLAVRE